MKIVSAGLALLLIAAPLSASFPAGAAAAPTAAALRQGCDGGDAKACKDLGDMYATDTHAEMSGVPVDDAQAAAFYRKACDGGVLQGCTLLGAMLYIGRGVAQDRDQAGVLLRKACAGGDNMACALAPKN